MNKAYLVSIYNRVEDTNNLHIVDSKVAHSEVEAVKLALLENVKEEDRTEDYRKWVKALGENFSEVCLNASNGELVISNLYVIVGENISLLTSLYSLV